MRGRVPKRDSPSENALKAKPGRGLGVVAEKSKPKNFSAHRGFLRGLRVATLTSLAILSVDQAPPSLWIPLCTA